ncbi:neuraminidase-like domain-containing protein [Nitrospira lenta]|uniref:Insecticidal toxin protein (Modular protein) n=1 Tax=Nitrospira lenta TaxID=1436998 RepID=A0A330L869_9BACT|nr:neuraminidase-like domain-containing protein [Nitrospira lenta]SPP65517.1 Putative insecticidal toxin protein (modular protein) [Nitrospira lenta]
MAKSPKRSSKTKAPSAKKPSVRSKAATKKPGKRSSIDTVETFVVLGTVTYADARPATGLTVIAYDKDESGEDRLGQATTDAAGAYTISYSAASFRRSPKERGGADVIVRVYNDLSEALFASKKKNNAPAAYQLNIQVPAQSYTVRGLVTDAKGSPLPNMIVRALDRDLRFPQLLGTSETAANGGYRIDYRPDDFQLGDLPSRRSPWLIVEVCETAEGDALAKQEVQKPDRDQTVSFTLSNVGVVSEWQRIGEAVVPLLKGQGAPQLKTRTGQTRADLPPEDIAASDLDFLAIETGFDRAAIQAWAASSRMVRDAVLRLTDEHAAQQGILRKYGWPFFYGLVRQGGASELDELLREPAQKMAQMLKAAVSAHQIPPLNEKHADGCLDALGLLQRVQQLDPVQNSHSDFAKVLANLAIPLPKTVALDALSVVQEKGLNDVDALLALAQRHPDAEAQIKMFVRAVRVHQLTSGHAGLSRVLNARLEGASDSIAPLASVRAVEWIGMAKEAGVSAGLALQAQAQVEYQHPLTALESKVHAGLFDLPNLPGSDVAALIKKQPAMVEKLLLGKAPVQAEESATHAVLRNTGRFVRTGVSMELAADCMKGGIDSPGAALRYGREHLRKQFQNRLLEEGVAEVLDGFYRYADGLVQGGNGAAIEIGINRRPPAHYWSKDLEEYGIPLPEPVRENAPTLAALFGDLDECVCRPCESMLGQPAYLVDLLNLLAKSTSTSGNALDVLRARRPDIFNLKLSCENAEQTIQHIDIVLEILEKAAALEAPAGSTTESIQLIAYQKLRQAIYPWHLPFDRGYAEVDAYLTKLGVSREKVLALQRNAVPAHLASEALHAPIDQTGNSNANSQWALLTQQRVGARLWAAYGFTIDNDIGIVDPASGERLTNQTVEAVLTRASFLIDRIGLSLEELEQALRTEFVSGYVSGIALNGREQCKTSAMRLPAEGPVLEGILDRLHRFTRLRAQLPGWSIDTLGRAIVACNGVERETTTDPQRGDLLVALTIVKRLHDDYGLSLDALLERPVSETYVRKAFGLSLLQFALLKELTGYRPTAQNVDWHALERVCRAVRCLREIGLSVEQAAHALLTREEWEAVARELPSSIKSDEDIETLLKAVQQRLRAVVVARPDSGLEAQAADALHEIYDRATADAVLKSIREASGPAGKAPEATVMAELVATLSGATGHSLGAWLPIMTAQQAETLFSVATANADDRFTSVLTAVASRRRERALLAVLAEQCGLAEAEVLPLLGARLLLDPAQGQSSYASEAFLNERFWADVSSAQPGPPSATIAAMPRLHAWMDRLHRLIALSAAVTADTELMQMAELVVVGSNAGINWRDLLASTPANSTAWQNPQWQAWLDLLWLQHPDRLSRQTLGDVLHRLSASGAQVSRDTVRPLTARMNIAEELVLPLMAQALSLPLDALPALDEVRNPGTLRRIFEWLLLAKHLGAKAEQMAQLTDLAGNTAAAGTAKALLEAKLAGGNVQTALQAIGNSLRRQRRDALVGYLVAHIVGRNNSDQWSDAKALYEHFLIDHQMEPCFETTRILEAVTAVQLFAQRILFGVEPATTAEPELRQRWTWMRNYRVWEANRKVFLFPENWLFPELRDDTSSSFKQLESALGQGELTQDLANQAFGKFLDDVAQMGQIEVLGMYEAISHDDQGNILLNERKYPLRRTLYVVGRTLNPPYAYFWRQCVDFGGPDMEWSPWQRIELDIQGDHVLPFLLGGQLYIAWPIIRAIKVGPEGATKDGWEIKLAWSRYDGKNWQKSSVSRDSWTGHAAAFSDERRGFAFRSETAFDGRKVAILVYALTNDIDTSTEIGAPSVEDPTRSQWDRRVTYPGEAQNPDTAFAFLDVLIRNNHSALPEIIKKQLEIYATWRENSKAPIPPWQGVLLALMERGSDSNDRVILFSNPQVAEWRYEHAPLPNADTRPVDQAYINESTVRFIWAYWSDAQRTLPHSPTSNYAGFNAFYNGLQQVSSRRTVICKAWIKLKAPDGTNPIAFISLTGGAHEGVYTCRIGTETIPFNPGVSYPLDWKLGGQPEVNCTLSLRLRGSSGSTTILNAPPGAIYKLGSISEGYEATQTVHFVIDGTMHNAIDIGFDLDAFKTLRMVSQFFLTRDDMVSSQSPPWTPQVPIDNPVDVSRPWMNGFREISTRDNAHPNSPLQIANYSRTASPIFKTTGASQFWVVGAASWQRRTPSIPVTWHYSESGCGGYVDLAYRLRQTDGGFLVYPDSYPEATSRRVDWSESRTLPAAQNQRSDFGANNLPVPEMGNSISWTDITNGVYTFDHRLPYACYNWEVFFHAPLLIADQLSKQHKFEDAERWLRFVFDPTSSDTGTDAKRFLKFRVFKELDLNQQVVDDLTALAQVAGGYASDADVGAVHQLIDRWRDAPFRPFLIARRRHIAFLWRTLFAYLDNLIAWADSLYRRDTRESINEATMLYVLAERILGRRPQLHQGPSNRPAHTYDEKVSGWDEFANFWIDAGAQGRRNLTTAWRVKDTINQPSPDGMLYFCMPFNDKIVSYWNIVDARLSNIRTCRNIEGIQRKLPLMDAPIDPELLVRATAAGLDLGDVIAGLYAPPPHYRYGILSARAAELANECKSLGAAMLSAIEKRDAEYLAQLRSSNEINLLKLVSDVRTLQITEAERNLEALRASRTSLESRYNQYQRLLGKKDVTLPKEQESTGEESMLGTVDSALASNKSSLGLLKEEDEQYVGFIEASGWSTAAGVAKTASGIAHMAAAPAFATLFSEGGAKVATAVAHGLAAAGEAFSTVSQAWHNHAEQQGMLAGHIRRRDEWAFQSNQTLKEMQQIDKQILASQIRIDMTQKELSNHVEQIEQAKAVDEVMRSKFSNVQLYEWMKTELSRLYFNTYRMALEMARKAERAASRELGVKPLNIVRNDYWDSLRGGLLAGERLHQDLKRLEIAYLDQNRREYELTRHISLRRLDPQALANLRIRDGEGRCSCEFDIPEWLFDLDTPGQYLRRIKSVSLSIPSVTGPYTSVSCKLTLLKSRVRHERSLKESTGYLRLDAADDDRFTDYYGASEAIVTSTGVGDSGLFETQLRDERFLPFEGNGVISTWRVELPGKYPQFDYATISDVVLSIRYTARDGGDDLRSAATAAIDSQLVLPSTAGLTSLRFPVALSCRSDFPTEWARAGTASDLTIPFTRTLLPYWMEAAGLVVREVRIVDVTKATRSPLDFKLVWPPPTGVGDPAAWPADALNGDGVGEGNLGRIIGSIDKIILLDVGVKATPAPSPP